MISGQKLAKYKSILSSYIQYDEWCESNIINALQLTEQQKSNFIRQTSLQHSIG